MTTWRCGAERDWRLELGRVPWRRELRRVGCDIIKCSLLKLFTYQWLIVCYTGAIVAQIGLLVELSLRPC